MSENDANMIGALIGSLVGLLIAWALIELRDRCDRRDHKREEWE